MAFRVINTNFQKRSLGILHGILLLTTSSLALGLSEGTPAVQETVSKKLKPATSQKKLVSSTPDGYSLLVNPGEGKTDSNSRPPSTSSESVELEGEDPDSAEKRAKKLMGDLVERANTNIETSVAADPKETKSGSFNADDRISSLSSITYHTNNEAICIEGENGKPDGSRCKTWLDKDVSQHGKIAGDSSPLERQVYEMWEGAKQKVSDGIYRIWNVALREGQSLKDRFGRLNIQGLSKYELTEEASKAASDLGYKSAEQALRIVVGDELNKTDGIASPPPEVLRALAVNVTKSIANSAVTKWAAIQAAKKGIEVITNTDMDPKKYKSEVENKSNEAANREILKIQAPLDSETRLSLEERVQRAESMKKANSGMVNPSFDGDQLVAGDPNKERYDEWAYRATLEQISKPSMTVDQVQRPKDIQLSQRQITTEVEALADEGDRDGSGKIVLKQTTPKEQLEEYNRQLEIAARSMEEISSESSTFANSGERIRSNKLGPGETILSINDLTPVQKRDLSSTNTTTLVQNPSPKVEIPKTASQLTFSNR